MCICLNCKYINICKQYFLIEKTHNEPNINFLVKKKTLEVELDVVECLSFKEKPGNWLGFFK